MISLQQLIKGTLQKQSVYLYNTTKYYSTCPHLIEADAYRSTVENARPYSEVPGPRPLPIIGNAWRLFPVIGQYKISDFAKVSGQLHEQYGRIVRLGGLIGRPDLLFVFDADEIEKLCRNEGPTPFRPSMPCLVKYKSQIRKDFFEDIGGVVGVHGEPWRQFRSRVQKPVLQLSTVKRYVKPLEGVTNEFLEKCENMLDNKQELPDDFDNEIHKWSLECIGLVALDTRLGCLDPNLNKNSETLHIIDAAKFALRNVAVLELKAPYWKFIPTPLWTKYVSNMDYFVEVCMKHIQNATKKMQKPDKYRSMEEPSLLEKVLSAGNSEKVACIMALDLILVGIDTISMAVCSMLYQLATRQEEQEKMYNELKEVFPDPNAPINYQDLEKLHYTKGFIKEVLRMYSTVIGNGRTLQEDTIICGYKVPKGVQTVFPTVVTGNMEEYVTDAASFRPERWMKKTKLGSEGKIHPFSTLPYGIGARMCLGRRFADLEMQILLSKLIRKYKIEYNYPPLNYAVTFMYAPDGPLKFKMIERNA